MLDDRLIKGVKYIDNLFHVIPYDLEKYLKALKILEKDEEVESLIKDDDKVVGYVVRINNKKIKVFKDKIIC